MCHSVGSINRAGNLPLLALLAYSSTLKQEAVLCREYLANFHQSTQLQIQADSTRILQPPPLWYHTQDITVRLMF
jgi:hypothetical protein